METDHQLQYNTSSPWSPSSSLPPLSSFIGSLVTLISKIDIRYDGILFHINPNDATLGLCNVICYGTEGRNNNINNGLQIPPVNQVYSSIIFTGNQIKEMILKPSTNCGDYHYKFGIAKGATSIINKPNYASKPPLPRILPSSQSVSSKMMMRQKIPIIKPQDYNALPRPEYPDLSFNDHWSYHNNQSMMHYGLPPNQDHHQYMNPYNGLPPNTSYGSNEVMVPATTNSLQSVFTTFPPAPISLRQTPGVIDFGEMRKNFEEYKMWIPTPPPPPPKKEKARYNIDGSYYMKSRLPFDDIGKPYNPFGPIARPLWKQEPFIDWSFDLKPPLSNYRGWV